MNSAINPADPSAESVSADLPALRNDTPTPAAPVPVLRLPVFVVAFWLLPKTIGPRLAASGWSAAMLASFLSVLIGLGATAQTILTTSSSSFLFGGGFMTWRISLPKFSMTAWEAIRAPLAALVTIAHGASGFRGYPHYAILILIALPIAVLLIAILAMPFAAAGERFGLLLGRCLLLTLWSSTMSIPFGVCWLLWPAIADGFQGPRPEVQAFELGVPSNQDQPWKTFALAVTLFFALAWLIVLVKSVERYAGPPIGPAWQCPKPRCRKCNYILSGLPIASTCPECNHPISDSLARIRKEGSFTRWRALKLSIRAALRNAKE